MTQTEFNTSLDPMILMDNMIKNTNATAVGDEMNHVFAGLSTASFVLLSILLLIHSKRNNEHFYLPYGNGILFFCSLVTLVADLSMTKGVVYHAYTLTIIITVGILVNIIGSQVFFQTPTREGISLGGANHSSIGILIWGITIPLALLEMLMAFCMCRKGEILFGSTIIATIFQKIIQATTFYFGIRHKVPIVNKDGASLYLKTISIYNFAMWLQSIVDGNSTMELYLTDILDGASTAVSSIYAALTTDYRLLCFLLFAELAIEVAYWDDESKHNDRSRYHGVTSEWNMIEFRIRASQYTGFGYVVGLVLLGTQFINALQFLRKNPVTPVVNVFGIFADFLVIVQGVVLILMANRSEEETSGRDMSKNVDVMVGLMGIVGLAYWIMKCSLIVLLFFQYSFSCEEIVVKYLMWTAAKFAMRIISLPFQLYFFSRITNSFACREEIRNKKFSYLILPCLMLSQLSVFVNSAIDSYSYIVEEFVERVELSKAMLGLYKMGEPLYLGFCLHMFFRFLIVNNNLRLLPLRKMRALPVIIDTDEESEVENVRKRQLQNLLGTGPKFQTV